MSSNSKGVPRGVRHKRKRKTDDLGEEEDAQALDVLVVNADEEEEDDEGNSHDASGNSDEVDDDDEEEPEDLEDLDGANSDSEAPNSEEGDDDEEEGHDEEDEEDVEEEEEDSIVEIFAQLEGSEDEGADDDNEHDDGNPRPMEIDRDGGEVRLSQDWHMKEEDFAEIGDRWFEFKNNFNDHMKRSRENSSAAEVLALLNGWYRILTMGCDDGTGNAGNNDDNDEDYDDDEEVGDNDDNEARLGGLDLNLRLQDNPANPLREYAVDYRTIFFVLYDVRDPVEDRYGGSRYISPASMANTHKMLTSWATNLHLRLEYHKLLHVGVEQTEQDKRNASHLSKLNAIFQSITNAYYMMQHEYNIRVSLDPTKRALTPSNDLLAHVGNVVHFNERLKESKPFAQLLLTICQTARLLGYRRANGYVYEQVHTPDGYPTHYWRRVMEMGQFIHRTNRKEHNFEAWANLVGSGNANKAVDYFATSEDLDFPRVVKDRHVFSFRNGLYFAAKNCFRPYADGPMDWGEDCKIDEQVAGVTGRKLDYVSRMNRRLHATNAAARYFDVDFHEFVNRAWTDIPTPTVNKIFTDQEVPAEAQEFWWALAGRMIYEIGEYDNWQIVGWVRGAANSGKSTLCKIPANFYDTEDVAVLSNNIQENFGLASVVDKFLFIAPEVKKDFKLNQAEFQQMVVGEHMAINRKFKDASTMLWKVPGMFSGNTVPGWMDHSCSVSRRIAMVHFKYQIRRVDQGLDGKLQDEMAHIILKANRAYLTLCQEYGNRGIWENVPQYFKNTNADLKADTHAIYNLFQSDKLEYGEDLYMTVHMFRSILSRHSKETRMQEQPWNEDYYLVAFTDRDLKVERAALPYPRGSNKIREGFFIMGIDKARHLDEDNGEVPIDMPQQYQQPARAQQEAQGQGQGQDQVQMPAVWAPAGDRMANPFRRFGAVPTIVEDE